MQTHSDNDFPHHLARATAEAVPTGADLADRRRTLEERARDMVVRGESQITVGAPGEWPLRDTSRYGVFVRRMPDDVDCLRITIGEAFIDDARYLVFRGDPSACAALLERAARGLRDSVKDF